MALDPGGWSTAAVKSSPGIEPVVQAAELAPNVHPPLLAHDLLDLGTP